MSSKLDKDELVEIEAMFEDLVQAAHGDGVVRRASATELRARLVAMLQAFYAIIDTLDRGVTDRARIDLALDGWRAARRRIAASLGRKASA
jgi:hypothetical protein